MKEASIIDVCNSMHLLWKKKTCLGKNIVLYIDDDNKEFLQQSRIDALLKKYCRFLPVPVISGKEQEWKDGKYVDTDRDKVINSSEPSWMKKPSELKNEDYINFYHDLYPGQEDPLFWIHLNVDYPFNLTGILFFPKIKNNFEITKNRIQLYCNQVYVTDSVEGVVPEFMMLLQGVIDSPDIPLNVSRSYLHCYPSHSFPSLHSNCLSFFLFILPLYVTSQPQFPLSPLLPAAPPPHTPPPPHTSPFFHRSTASPFPLKKELASQGYQANMA